MLQVARCDGCDKELSWGYGEFGCKLVIGAYKRCDKCGGCVDDRSKIYTFCSAQCLMNSVKYCPACVGNGTVTVICVEGEKGDQFTCGRCQGRGLEIEKCEHAK